MSSQENIYLCFYLFEPLSQIPKIEKGKEKLPIYATVCALQSFCYCQLAIRSFYGIVALIAAYWMMEMTRQKPRCTRYNVPFVVNGR